VVPPKVDEKNRDALRLAFPAKHLHPAPVFDPPAVDLRRSDPARQRRVVGGR